MNHLRLVMMQTDYTMTGFADEYSFLAGYAREIS